MGLGRAILRGSDTECYFVICECMGSEMETGTDTEYYCAGCEGLRSAT